MNRQEKAALAARIAEEIEKEAGDNKIQVMHLIINLLLGPGYRLVGILDG